MGNASSKNPTNISADNVLRYAYNVEDKTMGVNGFIVGKIGHKVEVSIMTTNVANDTERFTFTDQSPDPTQTNPNGDPITLYVIDVVYTDSGRTTFLSAERVA